MTQLNELFTLSSLLSLQGAVAAALLLPNALGLIVKLGRTPRLLLSLMVALLLAGLVALLAPNQEWTKWVVAFFNALLIFTSAVGINQGAAAASNPESGASPQGGLQPASARESAARAAARPQFFQRWF